MAKYPLVEQEILKADPTLDEWASQRLLGSIEQQGDWRVYDAAHHEDLLDHIERYLDRYTTLPELEQAEFYARVRLEVFEFVDPDDGTRCKGALYGNGAVEFRQDMESGRIVRARFFMDDNDAMRFLFPNYRFIFNRMWFG